MPSKPSSGSGSASATIQRETDEKASPKPRWSKPLERWLTRQLLRGLLAAGAVIPSRMVPRIGRALGDFAFRTMRRYRLVALANLRRAYGDCWSESAIREAARESFRNLGITLVEFFLLHPGVTPERAQERVPFVGQEHYEAAFARGRGVLLVTAHYGNWELMGPRLVGAGYRISAISRTADDPWLERTIEAIRAAGGVTQIPRRQAAREGLTALRRNEILAILLDQNTLEGGVFVPFFGYPASTATGPAVFALKTGAAIVPTFCLREPDGTHTMKAWPPIYPVSTGDRAKDVRRLTAEVTLAIEKQVRERPELWCWLHNRWKLQPPPAETVPPPIGAALLTKGPIDCKPCD